MLVTGHGWDAVKLDRELLLPLLPSLAQIVLADSSLSEAELLSSLLYTGETGHAISPAELRSLQRLLQDLGLNRLVDQWDIQLVSHPSLTAPKQQ